MAVKRSTFKWTEPRSRARSSRFEYVALAVRTLLRLLIDLTDPMLHARRLLRLYISRRERYKTGLRLYLDLETLQG